MNDSRTMTLDPSALHYSRHVGWAGSILMEVVPAAPSTVIVTFNYDAQPRIGVYATEVPEATFRRLLASLRGSGYDQLPSPQSFEPESRFVTLGERAVGVAIPAVHVFSVLALPSVVAALSREFEEVADEIRRSPERVLEVNARYSQASLSPGEPLSIEVALKNVGRLALNLGNPLGAAPGEPAGVSLSVRAARDPDTEQGVELGVEHLRGRPGASTAPTVALAPGAELGFELQKRVYLAPGDYTVALAYQNLAHSDADRQSIEGVVLLELGALSVQSADVPRAGARSPA